MTPTHPPSMVTGALLIGVDLGPNLSVTGSLATILWLLALGANPYKRSVKHRRYSSGGGRCHE